jgi:hypothetical protein
MNGSSQNGLHSLLESPDNPNNVLCLRAGFQRILLGHEFFSCILYNEIDNPIFYSLTQKTVPMAVFPDTWSSVCNHQELQYLCFVYPRKLYRLFQRDTFCILQLAHLYFSCLRKTGVLVTQVCSSYNT